MNVHALSIAVLAGLIGCQRSIGGDDSSPSPAPPASPSPEPSAPTEAPSTPPSPEAEANDTSLSSPHRVVFADRTSQGYLLLVDDAHAEPLTRKELHRLVDKNLDEPEQRARVEQLETLIDTEPLVVDPKLEAQTRPPLGAPRETTDLLGLHLDRLALRHDGQELVSTDLLTDPVLTRALTDEQRASLASRRHALLMRADYRHRDAVLGLRLLQQLVELAARDRKALIHDPDTLETMGVEEFARRRLHEDLGNIADQIAIVPFADTRHGQGALRLTTRGMRRFGSVDLELDGLPRDGRVLQAATDLLYGLAYQMVQLGEFDSTGYAVELPSIVEVDREDIAHAYGRAEPSAPCPECAPLVELHLVERTAEPHDPRDHVVARVVAPRPRSDDPGYEHRAWVLETLRDLLGSGS